MTRGDAEPGGLAAFAPGLHPDAVADVRTWADDPALGPLHARLDGHSSRKGFLDTWAEAMVARHLRQRGCDLQFEVPTPSGRACDFEVRAEDARFYLHVKRLDTERPTRKHLTISSRLRYLERIERPYVVSVRWNQRATDAEMDRLVARAAEFIARARVGEELVVRDDRGREIGGVLVVAPWDGSHVALAIGLPSGFDDDAPRLRKQLRRAYRQFMPREDNVILVCTSHADDLDDFERALLGSHEERWDAYPPRGRRIAHGRAADGFWHGGRYDESRAAGWFGFAPAQPRLEVALMFRDDPPPPPPLRAALTRLFSTE